MSFKDIPSLASKVAIVTGANSGIGLVTARELAKHDCHVILACRSRERAEPVVKALESEITNTTGKVEFMQLDMMSLKSIKQFVDEFKAKNLPLHILVNNAGIMAVPFQLSVDGIESQFATNHVGVMALTTSLLPLLESSAPARIVCVSSAAHKWAPESGIDFENINNEANYSKYTAYGQSKVATILFTRELHRQLRERGITNIHVNAVHPGVVQTNLFREQPWIIRKLLSLFQRSEDNGAKTQLYCATSEDIVKNDWSGRYFEPIAKLSESSAISQDMELAKKLWTFTEELIAKST
ncbi:WW domain-containing oxidoreductase-like isoform 2 [Thraustotheca clavata]|uniref:WW domain-containing oxidoreductase-like isoform 2 n=1 Tax=Thraustotheca clavata TaxID=74557 RepID=A0A1W0ACQ2_9STRA|nr:WW domain-containing oxidoreductase-like isoform 2 [Thraustotheca clavata]